MSQLADRANDIMDPQSLTIQLILCGKIQNSVNELRRCAKTLRQNCSTNHSFELNQLQATPKWKWISSGTAGLLTFHSKSLPLKQTKQEVTTLASSSWSKRKYIWQKECIERSLLSKERRWNKLVQVDKLVVFHFLSLCYSWLAKFKPHNASSSHTARDDKVSPCCPPQRFISNFSKQTWVTMAW